MNYLNPMNRLLEDQKHLGHAFESLNDHLNELRAVRSDIYKDENPTQEIIDRDQEEYGACLGKLNIIRKHLDAIQGDIDSAEEDNYDTHKAAVLWYVRQYKPGPTISQVVKELSSDHWSYYDLDETGVKLAITDLLSESKIGMSGGLLVP